VFWWTGRLRFYIRPCCRSNPLASMKSADSHLISLLRQPALNLGNLLIQLTEPTPLLAKRVH
jgi:hypothetical protein